MLRSVRCARCETLIPEPPDTSPDRRLRCPNCGSKNRIIEASATLRARVELQTQSSSATAHAVPPAPTAAVRAALADAEYRLQWWHLPEGAWMLWVFDRNGLFADGSIQDSQEDALLAVAETLFPSEGHERALTNHERALTSHPTVDEPLRAGCLR
jgi:DNA-directed RNA polymerase subunit RPC12/RpoP